MRKKIVAANWKMNMTQAEAARFIESMLLDLGEITDVEIVIVPPFTAIAKVMEALGRAQNIKVGAQNMYWEKSGPFTGEISGPLISPVKGPLFSQYIFCAPTLMFCALPSASITFAIAVNGGTMTISTSVISPRSRSIDSINRAASACVMLIFHLAATIFLRIKVPDRMNRIYEKDFSGNQFCPFC